jgi:anti-sigma factor RsiW
MSCDEARGLIHAFIDGELELRASLEMEQHLKECSPCASESERLAVLRSALREKAPYYQASSALKKHMASSVRAAGRAEEGWRSWPQLSATIWRWPVTAAAAAVLVAIILRGTFLGPSVGVDALGREVVASHVRSLMANHLTDVLSSNQHTVKPWFAGKLDFAPSVADLSAQGFPLVGGRLDFLDGRPVAALVYRYRLHIINLFTWPAEQPGVAAPKLGTEQGYNTVHWTQSGMEYWAVSDVAAPELDRFVELVIDSGSGSTSVRG